MRKQGWAVQVRRGFWADENGPTITEYAVLLVLIVFSVFASLTLIGAFLKSTFARLVQSIRPFAQKPAAMVQESLSGSLAFRPTLV